jgi:GntR family transcriptional regulator/MocR family aminotransferase
MLRPWDLQIVLDRGGAMPAWQQIESAIIDAIRRARLMPGAALPGTRDLAARIGVNRKTVQQAYDELAAQGWLTMEATRGTFVSAMLPVMENFSAPAGTVAQAAEFPLRRAAPDLPVIMPEPGIIRFDDGTPDTRLMPAELVARAYRRALLDASRRNRLGYGDPRGLLQLREAVAAMLRADRGLDCTADNICITRGSQMAIYLAARLLAAAGDNIGVEDLSYPPARAAFAAAGATILPIGLDEHGMKTDELEAHCRGNTLRAIYVTPHHQFPTTVVLPQQRRIQLLALSQQYGFAIVEDDYDHEFHFAHQPMLPLASADVSGKVVYIGSLSKILSPSLRLGYLVGPKSFIDRAASEIMMIDRQGDPATEGAVTELIDSGELHRHTRKVMKLYGERRDFFAGLLKSLFASRIEFTVPDGGLAFWVRFRDCDLDQLAAAAARHGVTILPASAFTTLPRPVHAARLGFASMDLSELKKATNRLRAALDDRGRRPDSR